MGTKSTLIPEILTRRYDLFRELEDAKYILANLSQQDKSIEAERAFIRQRVETLETELKDSEEETAAIIDILSRNLTAWTAARLHYFLGLKWEVVASEMGISGDAARSTMVRALKRTQKPAEFESMMQ